MRARILRLEDDGGVQRSKKKMTPIIACKFPGRNIVAEHISDAEAGAR